METSDCVNEREAIIRNPYRVREVQKQLLNKDPLKDLKYNLYIRNSDNNKFNDYLIDSFIADTEELCETAAKMLEQYAKDLDDEIKKTISVPDVLAVKATSPVKRARGLIKGMPTASQIAQMKTLRDEGKSLRKIGKTMGFSPNTVKKYTKVNQASRLHSKNIILHI